VLHAGVSAASKASHVARAVIPALAGSTAAGATWWVMAAATNPAMNWHSLRGAFQLGQSLYLLAVTTGLPNIAGLALLDHWLAAPSRIVRRGGWVFIGAGYGLIVLCCGIVTGSVLLLGPALLLAPHTAVPKMIGTLFLVREFYPIALVGGIVSIGGLMVAPRLPPP
jgi:hypothetical protein